MCACALLSSIHCLNFQLWPAIQYEYVDCSDVQIDRLRCAVGLADKGKDIELRHQRNPDVTFDCVRASEGTITASNACSASLQPSRRLMQFCRRTAVF